MKKNGILTLLFAFIPGAGQMYQGYMKRGLSLVLMAAAISMAAMLIPPIAFALLVVFMYSFFDTFNLRAQISTDSRNLLTLRVLGQSTVREAPLMSSNY